MRPPRRCIATIATGPYEELIEIARPRLCDYAQRHGYDLRVETRHLAGARPPAWGKVVLIARLLVRHRLVVWLDADTLIVDPVDDLAAGTWRPIHVTTHRYDGLEVPNSGVVVARRSPWTMWLLWRMWRCDHHVHHKWWENAALIELMGYDVDAPRAATRRRTPAARLVGSLDRRWNSVDPDPAPDAAIVHLAGLSHDDRLVRMRELAS